MRVGQVLLHPDGDWLCRARRAAAGGFSIEGELPPCDRLWRVTSKGKVVGQVTSAAWSPDFKTNVAIGMARITHWDEGTEVQVEGTEVQVETHDGPRKATVHEEFWI